MGIDQNRCLGCGNCVKDCLRKVIVMHNGKAEISNGFCLECGHCVAVCPVGAITLPGYSAKEICEYEKSVFDIQAEQLLNFMKFRRSVRRFKTREIEPEKLDLLLDAGRYAPTGSNRQQTRYIVLGKQKQQFIELALRALSEAAQKMDQIPELRKLSRYKEKWETLYRDWKDSYKDGLFYHAKNVILVVATEPDAGTGRLDAGLASANVELMANALGLGACYIGFFAIAAQLEQEINSRLGLCSNEEIVSTLALGYPDVHYHRTVNRKPVNVTHL